MSVAYAVPDYVWKKHKDNIGKTPPGHRFLLYFQSCGEGWSKLESEKLEALQSAAGKGAFEDKLVDSLIKRQKNAAVMDAHLVICAKNTSPIATGLGNPHPTENGFAFLSPYGIPYLSGSLVKGVIRRAAEELALFDQDSGWTLPLVWVLFGFEEKSAYIDPTDKTEATPLQEERGRMRATFAEWIDSSAAGDKLLTEWLGTIRSQLPKDKQKLTDDPTLFCKAIQNELGREVRRSIHWQGMLNFWDVFPKTPNGLAVDILNPHHKEYYEGKSTPNDSETPKPVFFLTVPPGALWTFICEMPTVSREKRRQVFDAIGEWTTLMSKAFEHAFEWLGFGAKTTVGYGAMKRDEDAEARQTQERQMQEAVRQIEEEKRGREEEARALKEAEEKRLAFLSPIDRSIEEILKNDPDKSKKPHIKLLEALKAGRVKSEEVRMVAGKIREMMEQVGEWVENPDPEKAKKDKRVKRTLEVMKFLEQQNGR
ncbi:MAG: type III-B CRISPR module RAMP protein Cmr6 [Alphaproteobacteria bacterium]|uniref:Type III-B CRISPR module RAMP protein Cmr6 n=1 Tax=Candidatus Nitrobium versatile TaxID=2884831 RepID=A0A953J5K8_9BACT|nr:type III-B CRISPR module RAMP protein Cmr6 [Candidatus Nitrobium versatile]